MCVLKKAGSQKPMAKKHGVTDHLGPSWENPTSNRCFENHRSSPQVNAAGTLGAKLLSNGREGLAGRPPVEPSW